jgi:hypothetical protein
VELCEHEVAMTEPIDERPHDVLAAEEFGMPAPDPLLHVVHVEPARDVLAAEEFGMPAEDPALRRTPLTLPEEPYPAAAPHDVLAAEEFAVPAGRPGAAAPGVTKRRVGRVAAVAGAFAALGAVVFRRRR